MTQTPPAPATGWTALTLSTIAATVFGLMAAHGAGLREVRLPASPDDMGWSFTALAWISTTIAPILAWIFLGVVVLVGVIAIYTRWFRSGPRLIESVLTAAMCLPFYALALIVLLTAGTFLLWLISWMETGFGTCVPPACHPAPAVP